LGAAARAAHRVPDPPITQAAPSRASDLAAFVPSGARGRMMVRARRAWEEVMLRVALLAGIVALGACAPTVQQRLADDRAQCAGYGFAPGTDGFAGCLMQRDRDYQALLQRQWDAVGKSLQSIGASEPTPSYVLPIYVPAPIDVPHVGCGMAINGATICP